MPSGRLSTASGSSAERWKSDISTISLREAGLPVRLDSPVCIHEESDDCGVAILGAESDSFWHDHKGAQMNAIRTRTLIGDADVVVVRFGEKYRQWNAAFDAGIASALGKALITLHDASNNHALKEVDAAALAVCATPEQVVQTLSYVINGTLSPGARSLAAE